MTEFQLVERAPKRLSFVGADPFDEVHQRRLSASGVRGLIQCVDHQSRDEFVAPVYRRIRCARSSRICETRFFLASRCNTVITVV